MLWDKNEIAETLPPVHRAEPPSLRAEILDELADHLACAMQRELRRTPDVQAARKAVVARFGNPASVARTLWFQAMKEVVMKDRIVLAGVGILALAVVVLAAFSWLSLRENQRTNQSLLAALKELKASSSAAGTPAVPSDLATATIRVLKGKQNGPPFEGINVVLFGFAFKDTVQQSLSETTNGEGIARFGPIKQGIYSMGIRDEGNDIETIQRELNLYGGRNLEETVVLPEIPQTEVRLDLGLPDALQGLPFLAGLDFKADGGPWNAQQEIAITPTGEVYRVAIIDRGNEQYLQRKSSPLPKLRVPVLKYRLERIRISVRDRNSTGDFAGLPADGLIAVQAKHDYESSSAPEFEALPGVENRWKIEMPQDIVARIEKEFKARETQKVMGTVDPGVADRVSGRIVKVYPVVKDCMVLNYIADWDRGDVDNIGVANNDGGVRALLGWPRIAGEETAGEGRRFLLALYSRKTTISASTAPGAIGVFEILGDWSERTSWKTQPAVAKDPSAKINFEPGDGWKLFDVTPIVRERGKTNRMAYGVELRFAEENRPSQDWSGYAFVSREGEKEPARRPVLIEVDMQPSSGASASTDGFTTATAVATESADPSDPARTR